MALLEIRGRKLEVERIEGAGPTTLVFLHEGLGCVASWRDFPATLAAATGCPALVYSRLGYGKSDPAPLPRPLLFMHEEALRVLPALLDRAEIQDAILVGHSDGASIALIHAAAGRGRVRGLILEAPHVFVEDICISSIAALRESYPGSELQEKLARRHADADAVVRGWTEIWLRPSFRNWNIEMFLRDVRAPSLVIQGTADEYGTVAQVDALCAQLGGPTERLILPEVGHAPHRDRPEEVLAAMAGFVRRLVAQPRATTVSA